MAEPAVCPRCEGKKKVDGEPCLTCDGQGVVWDRGQQESAVRAEDGDPLDLTFRP